MSLGVLNNLSAIYAENNLNNSNNSLSKTLQQLSSGSKINSGADDAAGLSLVNGLQANQPALSQSQTNATEGVGLLQVADGALSQVTNLLNRAVTLATEASNGTLNGSAVHRGQPGVPVDPGRSQQHRNHDHLQPEPGVRTGRSLDGQHLCRRLFDQRLVDRRVELRRTHFGERRRCRWHSGPGRKHHRIHDRSHSERGPDYE